MYHITRSDTLLHVASCLFEAQRIELHHIALHEATSRHVYHITSHHITSHHITSHHITSHHITSHHITSHHITLYGISSHCSTLQLHYIYTTCTLHVHYSYTTVTLQLHYSYTAATPLRYTAVHIIASRFIGSLHIGKARWGCWHGHMSRGRWAGRHTLHTSMVLHVCVCVCKIA